MTVLVADLLRLITIPVFAWLAWKDIQTRRVPNWVWTYLAILGGVLLIWETSKQLGTIREPLFLLRVGISIAIVSPLGMILYRLGVFGPADAKAVAVIGVLFPTYPIYTFGNTQIPLIQSNIGVLSLTIIANGVIIAGFANIYLGIVNILNGESDINSIFVSRPVKINTLTNRHGKITETIEQRNRDGLDLDVLRMYLRWRKTPLSELRNNPSVARNPDSIGDTHQPTDGRSGSNIINDDDGIENVGVESVDRDETDDPWGVKKFFDSIDKSTYGNDAENLVEGLELIANRGENTVWVSPGLPFLVPLFLGLIVALLFGDVLFAILNAIGLV